MKKHFFFFIMVIGVATGALLRLYRIGSQIIWDDEWHGIHVALFNPIKYILTHFHADDNCIPLSIYFRIMLKYIGLSEIIIRFPSLLSGLLILAIFPLCVKKLLNEKVAMTFMFLLAISPLLVYFSRLARPYGIVVLLSFIAIFAFYLWMTERKTIFAAIYLVSAVLAPYFSVSSLAFVLAPILYALMILLLKKKRKLKSSWENIPPLKHIAVVTIVVLAGIAVWMLPAVGTLTEVTNKSGQGFINLGTLGGCAVLFGGARSYILSLILILVFLYGSYVLYLKNKLLFSYLSIICFLQLLFLVLSRPFLVQSSIIFTRYYISSIPVWLLIISIALNDLRVKLSLLLQNIAKMANVIPNLILAALFLIIFLKGPISLAYSYPNDFTNHQDFQYYYLKPVPRINNHSSQSCPEFYFSLRNGSGHYTIVEFPAILSWYWNPFHIYQRLHRNRVIVGYSSDHYGPFFGYKTPLSKKIRFRNFVDISDFRNLPASGADFVIVHKSLYEEAAAVRLQSSQNKARSEPRLTSSSVSIRQELREYVSQVIEALERSLGKPIFEDEWIVVYKVAEYVSQLSSDKGIDEVCSV